MTCYGTKEPILSVKSRYYNSRYDENRNYCSSIVYSNLITVLFALFTFVNILNNDTILIHNKINT